MGRKGNPIPNDEDLFLVVGRGGSYPRLTRRSIAERNVIVEQWQGLPLFAFRILQQRFPELMSVMGMENAIAIGYEALIRSAELWDTTRNIKFNTYAIPGILRRILVEARSQGVVNTPKHQDSYKYREQAEHAKTIRSFDTYPSDQMDVLADRAPSVEDVAMQNEETNYRQELCEKFLSRLEERLQLVLRWRFFEDRSLREIADRLGITKERVRQLEVKALSQLRTLAAETQREVVCR